MPQSPIVEYTIIRREDGAVIGHGRSRVPPESDDRIEVIVGEHRPLTPFTPEEVEQ